MEDTQFDFFLNKNTKLDKINPKKTKIWNIII